MRAFLDTCQTLHDPKNFMVSGIKRPSPETPERISLLQKGAEAAGCTFSVPEDAGITPIAAVHSSAYLRFLQSIHARWSEMDGAAPEVIPNVHPANRGDSYPNSPVGQAGYHQADTACPIGAHTYDAAYVSAQCAIAAADTVARGENAVYALCRPPGHHAFADMAGGFCFLNNAAIAAQHLADRGWRPAILDVDVHHGNGTQGIFYSRKDVLTVSIHTDPNEFYPFFWGHDFELGEGDGEGANLNLPLPRGAGDKAFLHALEVALTKIADFGAQILVISLGLDAHESDPFKGMSLTTPAYTQIAQEISKTGLPLVLVQEGGYVSEDLTHNLTAFLNGIET
ncbi:MAG: histone deacetylase family protein [Pseudomonadota bacterium]